MTSDDLDQAVNANVEKVAAMESSLNSAFSDRFRRMQDAVQGQVRLTLVANGIGLSLAVLAICGVTTLPTSISVHWELRS